MALNDPKRTVDSYVLRDKVCNNVFNSIIKTGLKVRAKGKIVSWNDERGFGFIHPNDSDKQIFVHIKAFSSRKSPLLNQTVTYRVSTDKNGR
ncbi:MAG: cold shock domain-containing protein, partial [Flavobacteriaceae bacterium]|nr:cold shock domain-containing protein [Flavobacteriaceae bacterium]